MRFTPHTDDDDRAMLEALGLASIDELFDQIPQDVRLGRPLDLPGGVSEQEIVADLVGLSERNRSADQLVCFAGGGAYDHYIPAVVWALAGRSEFYTSYTPYQPELSQGILQALFEFQSMLCELTGMEVANASLYDGATAVVEAANMCLHGDRRRVIVADGVDPRHVDALRTYGRGTGYEPEVLAEPAAGDLGEGVAALVVQHPDSYGCLVDVIGASEVAHRAGAKLIQVFDPMTLGVLAPPGELGADIAVGEGQPLGNHLNFGGPNLGLLAAKMADVRRMPGRIVGATHDDDGRPGYVLTLQAREQHIRREKATSNICTNQTLMALAAAIYLGWLGPDGLRELGQLCASKAAYLHRGLTQIPGIEPARPGRPFFREFAIRLPIEATEVRDAMLAHGFLAGVPAASDPHVLVVAVTERRTREESDGYVRAMRKVLA